MATFWEIAAHSVDLMLSFVFCLFVILSVPRFGFEGWIWVLVALVPGLCVLFAFNYFQEEKKQSHFRNRIFVL